MLVRRHRSSLTDSLATTETVENFADLVRLIRADLAPFVPVDAAAVHVDHYGFDQRCGWDTYIVTIDGLGVWGFTDGPQQQDGCILCGRPTCNQGCLH